MVVFTSQITPGMAHKIFKESLAKERFKRSELQLTPKRSQGRPPRSSVCVQHCPVELTTDHFKNKSAKKTHGRKSCRLWTILLKKDQKTPWRCCACDNLLGPKNEQNCFQRWHFAECDKSRQYQSMIINHWFQLILAIKINKINWLLLINQPYR